MPTPFSSQDLGRIFDARALTRGRSLGLAGAVEVQLDGDTITGVVQDRDGVHTCASPRRCSAAAWCSTSSAAAALAGCAHLAAAAFAALDRFPALRKPEQQTFLDTLTAPAPEKERQRVGVRTGPGRTAARLHRHHAADRRAQRHRHARPRRAKIAADEQPTRRLRDIACLLGEGNETAHRRAGRRWWCDLLDALIESGQARWHAGGKRLVKGETRFFAVRLGRHAAAALRGHRRRLRALVCRCRHRRGRPRPHPGARRRRARRRGAARRRSAQPPAPPLADQHRAGHRRSADDAGGAADRLPVPRRVRADADARRAAAGVRLRRRGRSRPTTSASSSASRSRAARSSSAATARPRPPRWRPSARTAWCRCAWRPARRPRGGWCSSSAAGTPRKPGRRFVAERLPALQALRLAQPRSTSDFGPRLVGIGRRLRHAGRRRAAGRVLARFRHRDRRRAPSAAADPACACASAAAWRRRG